MNGEVELADRAPRDAKKEGMADEESGRRVFRIWCNVDANGIGLVTATWLLLAFAAFVTNYCIIFFWFRGTNHFFPLPLSDIGAGLFTL